MPSRKTLSGFDAGPEHQSVDGPLKMNRRILALACAATLAAQGARPVTPEALEKLTHSLIHRGDGKGRPDNTMEALLYTWGKGYTYLKLWELGFDSFGTDYPEALYKAVELLKEKEK